VLLRRALLGPHTTHDTYCIASRSGSELFKSLLHASNGQNLVEIQYVGDKKAQNFDIYF
jgi:hypothetical protein